MFFVLQTGINEAKILKAISFEEKAHSWFSVMTLDAVLPNASNFVDSINAICCSIATLHIPTNVKRIFNMINDS